MLCQLYAFDFPQNHNINILFSSQKANLIHSGYTFGAEIENKCLTLQMKDGLEGPSLRSIKILSSENRVFQTLICLKPNFIRPAARMWLENY